MSSDVPGADEVAPAASVDRVRVEDEMEQSYIDYAMSVIAGRALPDVRDGLKPVHRRILYAMHELGVRSGSSHRKSSSIVGETMGDYHPHGDSAIYDTLVRMAQEFSMRYPLVDGQGNFGSMDGDPPAAMRYTEARMAPIAEEMLADIGTDTVDFRSNYDDRLTEPEVLPAKVPNLLVNGSSGIAVGMSTNIPPHNLTEVIDAVVHLIDDPDCDVDDLVDTRDDRGNGTPGPIEGPDFPTGGTIVGREAVYSAYATGRGRVTVRASYELQRDEGRIVVTEIPFQENKSRMVERIAEDVNEGTIEGVSDHPRFVLLEGDLRDDDPALVPVEFVVRADGDPTAAGRVRRVDGLLADDGAAGREVRPLDRAVGPVAPVVPRVDEVLDVAVGVVDEVDDGVYHLAEVVRRDVRRHAHGDARRAVHEEVGHLRGEDLGLGEPVVVVRDEVDGVLADVGEHLLGDRGHPGLGVAHRRGRVAVHRPEVALAVDHRVPHREVLGHPHQRVVDRRVAMWVVVTHRLADDRRALPV